MQCEQFEARLNQLLDRRLRPEADDHLVSHAQGCESCGELLAAQELLFDGSEMLECPPLSAGFAHRVVAELASESLPTPSSMPGRKGGQKLISRWLTIAGSVAVVLVLVVGIASWVASQSGKVVSAPPGQPPLPPRHELANTVPGPAGKNPLVPPATANGYGLMLSQFPAVPRDTLEQVEQIPGGLRPITSSFGVAVGLIRNTALPRPKDETPPPKPQAYLPHVDGMERVV